MPLCHLEEQQPQETEELTRLRRVCSLDLPCEDGDHDEYRHVGDDDGEHANHGAEQKMHLFNIT